MDTTACRHEDAWRVEGTEAPSVVHGWHAEMDSDSGEDDRTPLRFLFEAASLRQAVGLAEALRSRGGNRVRVRPDALRLLTRERWSVVATTPPAPRLSGVVRLWQAEMQAAARNHPGCRLVGCEPLGPRVRPR
jgi:hypothetical protein